MASEEENEQPHSNVPGHDDREHYAPSDVDAMGMDKRRQVVGGQYGATLRKQLTVYGIFVAILAVVVIGFLTVVNGVDNRDIPLEDTAPWTEAAVQSEPRDVDFPCNGPTNTIPADQIGKTPPAVASDEEIVLCDESP